jgi:pre-rRNA-processing protein TSR1
MPAGITTKHGLQGHIVQSVGDHGVMKCLFNAPIKQHDTVCLPLYKRIFPKFAPVSTKRKVFTGGSSEKGDGEDATTMAGDRGLMKDFCVL